MNINLKLLSTFLAVAEKESFAKAATATNRSLPAVSMQIKQLEDQLGVAVFQRTTRKVVLTAEGEDLLISVRRAMAELDAGLARVQQASDIQIGRLSIACIPTIAGTRLPAVLTAFAAAFPGITVQVRELVVQALLESVRKREVDCAIGPVLDDCADLEFSPLFEDPYCALLPASYAHDGKDTITLAQVIRCGPLLKFSNATAFRDHIDSVIEASGVTVRNSYEFVQASTLIAMAEAGLGVALLPRIAIPRTTSLPMRLIKPKLKRTIAIISVRGHRPSPAAGHFIRMCHERIPPSASELPVR
ncbi:LysR family transcriptional regulator [Trinickia acidisoli]|uniref:LysR family transcriptional regulator n=1 Tax=Trinickia acidisoli TaxID=2767482 RepID=UPI001A8F6091|nr:LysR family transcriptional regulator [Trinickia acidisoli]